MINKEEIKAIPKINIKRLNQNIYELGTIGAAKDGSMNRSLASQADSQSRKWLENYWERLGLEIVKDPIANLWGNYPQIANQSLKPIVVGSHNDSVPAGGKYDGALGVLMATEVCQTFLENGIKLNHPFRLISLTGEEPNPYQLSTIGSKALTGIIDSQTLKKFRHLKTKESLADAINRLGGRANKVSDMKLSKNSLAAFLECHIEQGRRLFDANQPVAVVEKITGIYRELITIVGEANHAGTTEIDVRKDALLAASKINLELRKILIDFNDPFLVGTMGYLQVSPNAANIIPGQAVFNLDIRSGDSSQIKKVVKRLDEKFAELAKKGFKIDRQVILSQAPVQMDPKLVSVFHNVIHENYPSSNIGLTSMAGHDAANMVRVGRSGMLFVKSIDGKSHCKEEYSTSEDIEIASNILLKTILKLDKELP